VRERGRERFGLMAEFFREGSNTAQTNIMFFKRGFDIMPSWKSKSTFRIWENIWFPMLVISADRRLGIWLNVTLLG
jgi:hypothetical protein